MELRIVEEFKDGEWKIIRLHELKSKLIFRLFEADRTPVIDGDGNTIFEALSEPYEVDSTWGIKIKTAEKDIHDKSSFAKWTKREIPAWYKN